MTDTRSGALGAPIAPSCVSQETCLQVLGIPPRRFREWVQREHVPHRRLGQLVVVQTATALEYLRPAPIAEPDPADEVGAILARAGLRRVQ